MSERHDIVVVGAGHAGCEAAAAAARLGADVLLVTLRADRIGWMSCNPAIGGMAKGHLVREIDALGGLMAQVTDATGIQFRVLNKRRGPAVRGSRAQCDRTLYALEMQRRLREISAIGVLEDMVTDLVVGADGAIEGVRTEGGREIRCAAVVVTAGTFLNGVAHVGSEQTACGREGDRPALGLSEALQRLGLVLGRFKTGTTPRLDGRTIDLDRLEVQPGDEHPQPFSFRTDPRGFPALPQRPCHVTRTNPRTHQLVSESAADSPMYSGAITGIGPRYCPSFEDKVRRFADRTGHVVYLEPDGLDTHEVYPGGLSTSLPSEVQLAVLRTIEGLEAVEMLRPGYAIEYDFVPPHQVGSTLETHKVAGLFLAGQVNGTSGYEEAAAQGLMAGVNAVRRMQGRPGVVLGREQAYTGVLIDDLTTTGTEEPYRMFTSRAEHRLRLREDNADLRLVPLAHEIGLVESGWRGAVETRRATVEAEVARLRRTPVRDEGRGPKTLDVVLRRPEMDYEALEAFDPAPELRVAGVSAQTVELDVKYAGYVDRALRRLGEISALDEVAIPADFVFSELPGLSVEVREKLGLHRPRTLGQAARISGVTPAAVDILAARLLRHGRACG